MAKIRKICESLGATIYNIDENPDRRREHGLEVMARIEDINSVLYNTNQTIISVISSVAQSVESWTLLIRREKAVYHTMNLFNFDAGRKCLIAEGWCPSTSISEVSYALRAASERSGTMVSSVINEMQTRRDPPTFHKVNSFTAGFQEIVDSYGIAAYQEVNPGLFTVITFPFLFAVMFGDFGHGFMLACIGLYLVYKGDKFAKSDSEVN